MYDLYSAQLNDRLAQLAQQGYRVTGAKFSQSPVARMGYISPATGEDNSIAFQGGPSNNGMKAGIGGYEIEQAKRALAAQGR